MDWKKGFPRNEQGENNYWCAEWDEHECKYGVFVALFYTDDVDGYYDVVGSEVGYDAWRIDYHMKLDQHAEPPQKVTA